MASDNDASSEGTNSMEQYQVLRRLLPLATRDPVRRNVAINTLIHTLDKLVGDVERKKFSSLIELYMLSLLKLSVNCPFADIRNQCCQILNRMREKGVKIPHPVGLGPSEFIPANEIEPPDTRDETMQMLYGEVYIQNNSVDNLSQAMALHPHYLEVFLRTQNFLLRGDGPLPFSYRHYIAIMAAARHQCSYLVNLQKQEFVLCGGDTNWLKGLQYIPQKLRDIYEINKILSHRPWLITKEHIGKLTKGVDNWTLSEVAHAVVILAHFHTMSSLVYGCGIRNEIDQENGHTYTTNGQDAPKSSPPSATNERDNEVGVEVLLQRMKKLSQRPPELPSPEEKVKRFEKVETQAVELSAGSARNLQLSADISKFVEDPGFSYQDFARRGDLSDMSTFRIQDYSWDDHGYSLINSIYNDIGNYLDEMFKITYGLTYYTMGSNKCIDTSMFRRAIWNYIQCIFGIRHDDYDYSEVNHMIERNLKAYVKTVCVYPERILRKDYDSVMRDFHHSEKIDELGISPPLFVSSSNGVQPPLTLSRILQSPESEVHVNLMVVEARKQAELLYALRAITQYMT